MRRVAAYVSSLNPQLPAPVWLLEAGFFINAFGTGVAYPFLVIYLHNVRGFSLATAGLVIAVSGLAGLVSGPLFGRLVDRVGARVTLATALVLGACAFALFPFVHEPWSAFLVGCLVGLSSGSFWPSQSTLLAGLAPPARRHAAYAVQRGMFNLGLGLGGMTGGLIASTADPATFTVLFVVDAAATLAFCALIPLIPDPGFHRRARDEAGPRGGYRDVIRNRPFMGLIGLNVAFVAAGYTQLELLPVFAKNEAGVSERSIGLIFLGQLRHARSLSASRRQAHRGASADAGARGDAGGLGRCMAHRRRRWGLARGGSRRNGLRPCRCRIRDRRVPGRPRAGRADRRPRAGAPAGSLLGPVGQLLGRRLHRRSRRRRFRARGGAPRAVAARCRRVRGRGSCHRSRWSAGFRSSFD